ncbi:hypothetical protein [Gracilibacillus phocaeensis]|uniref:hypothetical protein n=1 Tax=Gracilibacillus phocaeensis TaxID=2042304 RepID=UPI00102F6A04|nr:hypothetical protein [Gracilibacillus phocaeensis]
MQAVQTLLLFLVVFVALYAILRTFFDPPKGKLKNFIAITPALTGAVVFLIVTYLFPEIISADLMMTELLAANLLPTLMVLITFVLLMKLKITNTANE